MPQSRRLTDKCDLNGAVSVCFILNFRLLGWPESILAVVASRIAAKNIVVVASAGMDIPQTPYPLCTWKERNKIGL